MAPRRFGILRTISPGNPLPFPGYPLFPELPDPDPLTPVSLAFEPPSLSPKDTGGWTFRHALRPRT